MSSNNTLVITPDVVSDIVSETAKKLAPLDLREFQGELYRKQYAARTSGFARETRKLEVNKYRRRVRHDVVANQKIVHTGTDLAKTRLYFELGNGQIVRADRVALRTTKPAGHTWGKGRRRLPFKNGQIWRKVALAIETQANRPIHIAPDVNLSAAVASKSRTV